MRPSTLRQRQLRLAIVGIVSTATWLPAAVWAQSSPYYLGISQTVTYEDNLYRRASAQEVPAGGRSRSDVYATTALVAGIDQTWGRQRLKGSGSLNTSRFARNDQLNNEGWDLDLGVDWSTVERLSGRVNLASRRSLRSFDPIDATVTSARNIESTNLLAATVRLGDVTRLTGEVNASLRNVRYSAKDYVTSEYDQPMASLGVRYRLGGATTVGLAWRQSRVNYLALDDDYRRRDIDFTGSWVPSAITSLSGRISVTQTRHAVNRSADFSGPTWELIGRRQVSGKLKLGLIGARELGQGFSVIQADLQPLASRRFDRKTDQLRLTADYDWSAKISASASLQYAHRRYASADLALSGTENTTTLTLNARWQPLRSVQVGCNLSHEQRQVSTQQGLTIGNPYRANVVGCYGQIVLQ